PHVSRWEKVDDSTVRVHTSEPAPTLWDALGREPLVPKAWTIKHGVDALNEKPVGTGAWKLVEWKRKTHMILERNEGYWGTRTLLALAYAVNRDAIIKKIFQGFAIANASPVATVSYGYVAQEPYPYDPKRAKALLAEAGWKDTGKGWERNGEPLILNLHFAAKHYGQAFDETTAAVTEMLKDVGVQVTLKPIDFGTMLQITQKG